MGYVNLRQTITKYKPNSGLNRNVCDGGEVSEAFHVMISF